MHSHITEEKDMDINKSQLQRIHYTQLQNGFNNEHQQQEVIKTLGGVDNILHTLLTSNAVIHQHQLQQLHCLITHPPTQYTQTKSIHIRNSTSQMDQDENINQSLHYNFLDTDTFLYSWFKAQNAAFVVQFLSNNVIKVILVLLTVAIGILWVLTWIIGLVSVVVYYWFAAIWNLSLSLYIIIWMLYTNKKAIRLLFKQFEIWFKLFYLIQFLIAHLIVQYIGGDDFYVYCSEFILLAVFLLFVMMFDAINMKQSNKILTSSLAVGLFCMDVVASWRLSFFRSESNIYDETTFILPNHFGLGEINISAVDILTHSSQILAIFLIKQLIASIRRPQHATVIRNRPFIEYEDTEWNHRLNNIKTIKTWKAICIGAWLFMFVVDVFFAVMYSANIIYWIIILVLIFHGFICLFFSNIQFIYTSIIICFVVSVMYAVGSLVLHFYLYPIFLFLILFGITAAYGLKVAEYRKYKKRTDIEIIDEKGQDYSYILLDDTDNKSTNQKSTTAIQMNIVQETKHIMQRESIVKS
eukprot:378095_1